jgi:hypothetical protein
LLHFSEIVFGVLPLSEGFLLLGKPHRSLWILACTGLVIHN